MILHTLKRLLKSDLPSPHDWILLQQLSARKQRPKEPLGDYIASMLDQLKSAWMSSH